MDTVLVKASLSKEKEEQLVRYLHQRVQELLTSLNQLFQEKVVKWSSAYEARPREEVRQFPFQNASNLIIPIVAIHTDTLHAQLMAAIFKTKPLVATKIYGTPNPGLDLMQEAYQEFMEYVSIEPEELDLYRVYNEGLKSGIKFGTVTFKVPWESVKRDFFLPGGDGTGTRERFITETVFEGPRPEKIPFTGFLIPPSAKSIETSDFKAHKKVMTRYELEERKFREVYDAAAVDRVLSSPDRTAPQEYIKEQQSQLGIQQKPTDFNAEWDVFECHLTYHFEGIDYSPRMIATYHDKTQTLLRVVYDNFRTEWFVGGRLLAKEDLYYGDGFAETLFDFQEGASETYNGFRDNQTIANTRVWRVSPDSKCNEGYNFYPSAKLPAEEGELEAMAHGDVSQVNIEDLRLLLELAERRSGVSPPQQGYGAGVMTGRRGVYSAMGTLALIQEGNSRKDLTVSDMRDVHTRIMRLVTKLYAIFGADSSYHGLRLERFGRRGEVIKQAVSAIESGQIAIPVYASSASVNREVEKQNDIMLSQVMTRHYQTIAQMLGAMQSPMSPPGIKEYFTAVVKASNSLMKKLLRSFGHDDVDVLVPEPKVEDAVSGTAQQGSLPYPNMAGGPRGPGVQ